MREPLSICRAGLGLAEAEPALLPREAESDVFAAVRGCRVAAVFCAGRVSRADVAVVGRCVRLRSLLALVTFRFCGLTLTFTLLTFTFRLTLRFLLAFTLLYRGA